MTRDLPQKIGILAGAGDLPEALMQACDQQNIETFIIAFEGQTPEALTEGRAYKRLRLGQAEKILSALRAQDIHDLVLIGSIRRPSLKELMPDLKAARLFARLKLNSGGDNDVLSALRLILEEEGFTVHGAHRFMPDLLAPVGAVGRFDITSKDKDDILRGVGVVRNLGALDVGQAAIVQDGIVLGVEGAEGTDGLIARCKNLHRKGRGGVLIKLCKPQQDEDLDLPTIGPATVEAAIEAGLRGIVVHAGKSLLVDAERVAMLADKHKIFVSGIRPEDYDG